jgi:alpha-beta hydrolase superfamily lysophospholipase
MPTHARHLPFRSDLALALVALLVGLSSCTTVTLDEEVLFQGKPTIVPGDFPVAGYALERLQVPLDGSPKGSLDGWYLDRPGTDTTVLYFGGQGFHMVHARPFIEVMSERDVDIVMFDYRGYGKSGGSPTVPALKQDAMAIVDLTTKTLGVKPANLVVHGHSMGTFLATHVAAEHEVAGVVLENPASDVEEWREETVPFLLRVFIDFEVPDSLASESNVERVKRFDAPLLVFAGSDDKVTPPQLADSIMAAAKSPNKQLITIPAGHNDVTTTDEFAEAYDAFLKSL